MYSSQWTVLIVLTLVFVSQSFGKRSKEPCKARAHADVEKCTADYKEDIADNDLSENEECCILARQYYCVYDSYRGKCNDEDASFAYWDWRKTFDTNHNHTDFSRRCVDFAHDTLQCIYLNHKAAVICTSIGVALILFGSIGGLVWYAFLYRRKRIEFEIR